MTDAVNPYQGPAAETAMEEEQYQPKIFAMSGRIGRLRYFAYSMVYNFALYFVLGIMAAILVPMMGADGGAIAVVFGLFYFAVCVAALALYFILARRRLNDLDKTGWLSLLMLVPIVNALFGLYLLFASGTKGTNDYGPAPVKNSGWLWVVGFGPMVLIVLLAAISIPQYNAYIQKTQAAQYQNNQ